MNIIYILHSTDPYAGSTKAFLHLLQGIMTRGVNPVVVLPDENGITPQLKQQGVETYVINYRPATYPWHTTLKDLVLFLPRLVGRCYLNWKAVHKLGRIFLGRSVTLIHTNVSITGIGIHLSRLLGVPHIIHFREYAGLDFSEYFPSRSCFYQKLFRSGSYNICITKDIQLHHRQHQNPKSVVIYDGVRPNQPLSPLFDVHPVDPTYFLYAGRIQYVKGLDLLFRAYQAYYKSVSDPIPLLVAGSSCEDDYFEKLKTYVQIQGLTSHIRFLGERSDIDALMREAKALIVPSRSEGFGFCMAEAMFNGCLVIGHDVSGTHEQFENGREMTGEEIGLRYSSPEELTRILLEVSTAPSHQYRGMVERANHVVNQIYSIQANVEQVYHFYAIIHSKT